LSEEIVERIRYPRFVAVPQFVFSLAPKRSLT